MAKKSASIFILSIFASINLQATVGIDPQPVADELLPHQVNYNRIDERAARTLQEIFDRVRTHQTAKVSLSSMGKTVLLSPLFTPLKPYVDSLGLIENKTKTLSDHYQNCAISTVVQSDPLAQQFSKTLTQLCDSKFLRLLNQSVDSKPKKKLIAAPIADLQYLWAALPRLLQTKFRPNLTDYFAKLDPQNDNNKQLSQLLIEQIISQQLSPEPALSLILQTNRKFESFDAYIQQSQLTNPLDASTISEYFAKTGKALAKRIEDGSFEAAEQAEQLRQEMDALIKYYQENKKNIPARTAWHYFTLIGKEWRHRNFSQHAKKAMILANEASPKEELSESYFQLVWDDISQSNWDSAQKTIEQYNLIEKFAQHDDKLQFWIAYNVKMLGQKHLAKHLYSQVIHRSPLSYYAIISLKELAELNDVDTKQSFYRKIASELPVLTTKKKHFSTTFINHLTRLKLWADLGLNNHSEAEFSYLISLKKDQIFEDNIFRSQLSDKERDQLLIEIVATMMSQSGHHLQTFKMVFNALGERIYQLDRKTLNYLFPLHYFTEIQKFSQGLNPLFVLSLIRQESAFNPGAKSHVGATGLMQLMPKTAAQFQSRLKGKMLESPELNIKIGVKYLRALLERYDGNMILALAAYNAGKNRVDRWKSNILTHQNPLVMIESIPYKETRQYVQLIYRNLFFYNYMQSNQEVLPPLSESFKVSLAN